VPDIRRARKRVSPDPSRTPRPYRSVQRRFALASAASNAISPARDNVNRIVASSVVVVAIPLNPIPTAPTPASEPSSSHGV
jgi:hypothetical protein